MGDIMHTVTEVFNKVDYAVLGIMTAVLIATLLTPMFKLTNSGPGRSVSIILCVYFYARWQMNVMNIPAKVLDPTTEQRIEFYRITRNVYMDFSCFLAALFIISAGYLRGHIAQLQKQLDDASPSQKKRD
mmetsp:Transcript_105742/g.207360  ORF Transcript_105742/g.207360 Transcript_105742/m.207360 type:complete len:130 (+) Transcript_105742:97-486(+)|eukprot:CAMPEP_0170261858 /NCGR_PEP_ID=MMETSP0116_2-20130129/30811_1 /TAXON_ID=400756 /ORGANISM="Durinskia baltica, Strain CSIRO CS-38" /LENGTH=129 /DNA_ID=CAMNT_0010512925 /DNA_START=98 /DNA_END=487 /DNA_ORIENTATION=-